MKLPKRCHKSILVTIALRSFRIAENEVLKKNLTNLKTQKMMGLIKVLSVQHNESRKLKNKPNISLFNLNSKSVYNAFNKLVKVLRKLNLLRFGDVKNY